MSASALFLTDAVLRRNDVMVPAAAPLLTRMRLGNVVTVAFSTATTLPDVNHILPVPTTWTPGPFLRLAKTLALDLGRSWLVTADLTPIEAAASAGLAGLVVLDGEAPTVDEGRLLIAHVADLKDCTRVMVPRGGGCWHGPT
jgi:hypothetical protein